MEEKIRVAIDGPAGAGKSSVARAVAQAFSIAYLDTGAMYRALGLKALKQGVGTGDEEAVGRLAADTHITVAASNGDQRIYLDGRDVTGAIRTEAVSRAASDVSRFPAVRRRMVELQQAVARESSVVMDGRDIGTHVMPFADCKIYLTATADERARRRHRDLLKRGTPVEFETLLQQINERDRQDTSREYAPLRQAEDAVFIDTTHMGESAVIERVIAIIKEKLQAKGVSWTR
ncbi:MAG: (d)CMP kinase [Christensenellales bacterium]|jgi:cytidylate kinase